MNTQMNDMLQRAENLCLQGQLMDAQALYLEFAMGHPQHSGVRQALGLIDYRLGRYQRAATLLSQAIAIDATQPAYYVQRGCAYREDGQYAAAIADFNQAIHLNPASAEAYLNLGFALQCVPRYDEAIASYREALRLQRDNPETHFNLAWVLFATQCYEAAAEHYAESIRFSPARTEAYLNRGVALFQAGRFAEAIACYDEVLHVRHEYAEAYVNRGAAEHAMKQHAAAMISFARAICLQPDTAEIYYRRAGVQFEQKHHQAAADSYGKVVHLQTNYPYAYGSQLQNKMLVCDWQNFDEACRELNRRIEARNIVSMPFPLLGLSDSPAIQRMATERLVEDQFPSRSFAYKPGPRGKKIRLGYYSADFHEHATMHLVAELFERHDKNRFELFGFSFGPEDSGAMRTRVVSSFDRFIDVRQLSDDAVAQLSRELGIDIAIDLKAFTQDSRPGIFARRAAPLQVNFLGYPGTMGADYIDYLFADSTVIPEQSQQYYVEKVVYMPHTYQVNDRLRPIATREYARAELGLPETGMVFCCFNNCFKITPAVFDCWMRILRQVEGSVLWLLDDNSTATANLIKEAERRGMDPRRLVFGKRLPVADHLARHRAADLFLDTLPCNAHTTTSDALWAGLPVVTCMGETFASRVAASLLKAIGLPELVTTSLSDYESLVVDLANTPEKLRGIRRKLGSNRLTTPLFDTHQYTKHLEEAYLLIHERHCLNLAPDHIYVPLGSPESITAHIIPSTPTVVPTETQPLEKADSSDFTGRFREIVSDPLNLLIERVPHAGLVCDGLVSLHNGNQVPVDGPLAYYDNFSQILVINRGVHEPLEEYVFQELLRILPEAPTMLELGAYWGHYSMWMKRFRPAASVHLVEPDEQKLAAGEENFRINGFEGEFVQAFVGKGHFSVDTYLQTKGLNRLDVLHADIQSYEVEMLDDSHDSLRHQRIDYVFVSTHSNPLHAMIVERLKSFGYRVEVSSDFDHDTTSCDGFVFASSPQKPPVFKQFKPTGRLEIAVTSPRTLLDTLRQIVEGSAGVAGG